MAKWYMMLYYTGAPELRSVCAFMEPYMNNSKTP